MKTTIKKRLQSWKTTVIGVILILSSLAYLYFVEDNDKIIFFGTLLSGILLLLSPDVYVDSIKRIALKLSRRAEKTCIEDEINKEL